MFKMSDNILKKSTQNKNIKIPSTITVNLNVAQLKEHFILNDIFTCF